jgi:hypothetical protein
VQVVVPDGRYLHSGRVLCIEGVAHLATVRGIALVWSVFLGLIPRIILDKRGNIYKRPL